MRIDTPGFGDFHHVASRMRDSDFREFSALHPVDTKADLATRLSDIYGWREDLIGAYLDDRPVAVGAAIEATPNVLTLLFLATDDFPLVAFGLTRFIVQRLFPPLKAAGVHRIQCVSIDGYDAAHRWIETLGLAREGAIPKLGKAGETFHQFAWVADAGSTGA
jgi:hypothetical protein